MDRSESAEPCCPVCTHGPATPCVDALECVAHGPLCHDDPACREERAARRGRALRGGAGPALFVGAGTCGRANGALAVVAAARRFLAHRGLEVPVVETGCVGYCQREVFVDLVTAAGARLSYCDVSPDNVSRPPEGAVRRGRSAQPLSLRTVRGRR